MPPASDEFDLFWTAYPNKTAKGAARRAWEKAKRREPEVLMKCLAALAWQRTQAQWLKEDGAFVPHPATYLNQDRWDDEPPAVRPQLSGRSLNTVKAIYGTTPH